MHHQKLGKVRSLTLGEVSGEIHQLKSEISAIKAQIAELKKGKEIKEEEESWNTGSRHKEIEIAEGRSDPHFGFQDMRLFTITYQQHHVKVKICIQGQIFFMTALLDSGADINILNIRNIPAEYWVSAEREVVGLGNKKLKYEIPRASLCFDTHCVYMKFAIADIPVDCILGNVFLAAVEPHGSARIKGSKAGYFISVPTSRGTRKRIELPYVSTPRVSTMVQAMQKLEKAESLLTDLKDLKGKLRIEEQLKQPKIKRRIIELKEKLAKKCCSEEPNAFWHRKQHTVKLPYKEDYKGKPCKSRAIPMSQEYRKLCQQEIQQLLNRGLIRESTSPWNCYGFYVNKRAEQIRGIPRLVINYKPLNSVLADDTYPIPHKGDLIRRIAGAKVFSKFDLKAGFWQVAVHEEDKFKTAFSIPAGHYEWNVMPFGLKNAPSNFQKVMDDIFKPYFDWLLVYIDDVLIFSRNLDDHFKHVNIFMNLVRRNGLVLSKKKMELFQTSIKFLGHQITNGQISLQKHAIEFADKFPDVLKDKTQLQRFLGCLNYVSSFYQDCASDRKVLNKRTGKNPPPWTDAHTKAVQEIKAKVKSLPILYIADDEAFKIVESDASDIGWGGILKQMIGEEEQIVQFA